MDTQNYVNERRAEAIAALYQISSLIEEVMMSMGEIEMVCEDRCFYPDGAKQNIVVMARTTAEMERLAQVSINMLRRHVPETVAS